MPLDKELPGPFSLIDNFDQISKNLFRSASSVDAVMYGYLAPLLKAPYPNNTLQEYISSHRNIWFLLLKVVF